jgi:hypothetical protein
VSGERSGVARKRELPAGLNPAPFKVTYELPDGGRVVATDNELVPMGDTRTFRQVTYTHDGDADRPACTIVFEVRKGVPVCASVHLSGTEDGQTTVRAKDLKAIALDNLRADVFAYAGVFEPNPDSPGGWVHKIGGASFQQDRKKVERAQQRRKITPEFLSRVAELHNSAAAGSRLATVIAAFNVEERQALRYIRLARDKGLIDG